VCCAGALNANWQVEGDFSCSGYSVCEFFADKLKMPHPSRANCGLGELFFGKFRQIIK
jgi:hypothetical protein